MGARGVTSWRRLITEGNHTLHIKRRSGSEVSSLSREVVGMEKEEKEKEEEEEKEKEEEKEEKEKEEEEE